MTWVFGVFAVSLGIYFLWGFLAPRSQWRTLSAWSVSNPHTHEPGGGSYGWRRLFSGVGVLGLALVATMSAAPEIISSIPQPERPVSAVQVMWGSPDPQLVNRSILGSETVPEGLVEVPVVGYQDLDELDELPSYLLELDNFRFLGKLAPAGYIGATPVEGFSGIGPADLVVNVRGSVLCIPREAVVIETDTSVQIAIYYGLPDPATDPEADDAVPPVIPDHAAGCPLGDAIGGSLLIPITLSSSLGDRTVETLDGDAIPKVDVPR